MLIKTILTSWHLNTKCTELPQCVQSFLIDVRSFIIFVWIIHFLPKREDYIFSNSFDFNKFYLDFVRLWYLLQKNAEQDLRPYLASRFLLPTNSMGMEKFHLTELCQGKSSEQTIDWQPQLCPIFPISLVLPMLPSIYFKFKTEKKIDKICFDDRNMWCNSIWIA